MKKLITTMVAAATFLTMSAAADANLYNYNLCKIDEAGLKHKVANTYENMGTIGWLSFSEAAQQRLNANGLSLQANMSLSSGSTVSFSLIALETNMAKYMIHLSENYSTKDKMITKLLLYITRPNLSILNSFKKSLGEKSVGALTNAMFLAEHKNQATMNTLILIENIFSQSNRSTEHFVGHLEPEFQDFLYEIATGNFVEADKILNDSVGRDELYNIYSICQIYSQYN